MFFGVNVNLNSNKSAEERDGEHVKEIKEIQYPSLKPIEIKNVSNAHKHNQHVMCCVV